MRKHLNTLLAGAAILALPLTANATLVVTSGIGNQTVDNVISNACAGQIDGPAATIQGCLSRSHSTLVSFTSEEDIQFAPGGQAEFAATPAGRFSKLNISVVGHTFETLVLDVTTRKLGDIFFTDGTTISDQFVGTPPDSGGSFFFTITDSAGGSFNSISFTTVTNGDDRTVLDVKDVQIGGIDPPLGDPVPEPASITLLGVGLLGLGTIVQRRRNRG